MDRSHRPYFLRSGHRQRPELYGRPTSPTLLSDPRAFQLEPGRLGECVWCQGRRPEHVCGVVL